MDARHHPQSSLVARSAEAVPVSFPQWPSYDDEEIQAVADVLKSGKVNYWTGDIGRQFECEYADAVGTEHAIAVANGTLALELALYALGIGPGDEVIVPARTFVATATSVLMRGAKPIFADVDAVSGNVTAATIEPLISAHTRAVICVHLAGWPCEMDNINALARRHGIRVIEDCAQAHGATYHGRPVGSLGDIAAFSFCQDKIITTGGEGGMVTTSDKSLWKRAWSFKDHGKDFDTVYHKPHPGVFRWLHDHVGTNWRLTEMQSAIGRLQLRKLPEWTAARRRNAETIRNVLSCSASLCIPKPPADMQHAWYKFYAYLTPPLSSSVQSRDEIVMTLQQRGIPAGCGSCGEIYLEKGLQSVGVAPSAPCTVSQGLSETSLMFPVHPTMSAAHMKYMAHQALGIVGQFSEMIDRPTAKAA